jgi:hypothetical protein
MGTSTPQLYGLYDEDIKSFINTHVGTANYLLQPTKQTRSLPDAIFAKNEEIWDAILPPHELLHANVTVRLDNFYLFEWLPRSPGLYHTHEGRQARQVAENFRRRVPVPRLLPTQKLHQDGNPDTGRDFLEIYDPYGKISMLQGGIGCVRLRSKPVGLEDAWFMSASSSGIAHEGFPVAIPDHLYQRCIDDIRRFGAVGCSVTGKLRFLPEPLIELYRGYRGVPQLYLLAEEVEFARKTAEGPELFVTVGVSFLSNFEGQRKMYASYATFDPSTAGSISETAEWLEEVYVKGLYGGSVVTDFDEQMARFASAAFSLNGLMRNELDRVAVQTFVDTVNIYGGDTGHLFAGLSKIEKVYIERIEKMEQSGGVNISGTNISVGGDVVGRDKVVTEISKMQLDQIFVPLSEAVRTAPAEVQQEAAQKVEDLKKEAGKGKNANDSLMAKLLDGIVGLVPSAVGAVVSAFGTPILGGIAGPATKYVLDKIQGK